MGAAPPVVPMLKAVSTASAIPVPGVAATARTDRVSIRSIRSTWRRVAPGRLRSANAVSRSETDMANVLTTAMAVKARTGPTASGLTSTFSC